MPRSCPCHACGPRVARADIPKCRAP
ncbi:hypothetical protein STRTUCAR8_04889, partial [Streptomyces turgidiscabies Car8]